LFWKNKHNDAEIFSYDANDRRSSFRVRPPATEPIRIAFRGKSVLVHDIGAGGLSFCDKDFNVGDAQSVTISLPGEEITIRITVEIIDIDRHGVCHCRFTALSHDAINALHRYMLKVQKHLLQQKKSTARQMSRSEVIADHAGDDPVAELEEQVEETMGLSVPITFSLD